MLQLFKKDVLTNSLLMLPYAILIRVFYLVNDYDFSHTNQGLILKQFYGSISLNLVEHLLSVLLLFIEAFLINNLVKTHKLGLQKSLYPGVIYIILMSFFLQFGGMTPILIANLFLIIATDQIFKIYQRGRNELIIFNSGFGLGIASLICPPYLLFSILFIWTLFYLTKSSVKHLIQYVIATLLPFYLFTAYNIICQKTIFIPSLLPQFSIPNFSIVAEHSDNMCYLFFLLFIALVLFFYNRITIKISIQVLKKISVFYGMILTSFFLILCCKTLDVSTLQILSLPLSVLTGIYLARVKSKFYLEFFHLLMLLSLFTIHFSLFL